MKSIARSISVNTFALFIASQLLAGLSIQGGFASLLTSGVLLSFGLTLLRPVINFITLPLHIVTLGLFSIVTTTLIVYLTTIIYAPLEIKAFTVPQLQFVGITTSSFHASAFLSYFIISATIYAVSKVTFWLFE